MATIVTVKGYTPKWGKDCYIADNATLAGDIVMGDDCSVWFGAVLRADVDAIRVGNRVNIQDNACVHQTEGAKVVLEDDVSVGHGAIVHAATVRKGALIGMNAVVLDGCDIGENAIIAAGAVVLSGTKVGANEMWAGVPAKFVKKETEGKSRMFAEHYMYIKEWYSNNKDMENEVLKAIETRRSIRRFTNEQVSDDELETVLKAGTWAPTGMGKQDPFIVAVQDKEQLAQLSSLNAKFLGHGSDPYYGAPTHIYVFAPRDEPNNVKDGSLVLGTMMLAAHSIGLATCWINRVDKMAETDEMQSLMKKWGLPEGLMGVGSLAIGHAAAQPHSVPKRKEGYYRIIK